MNNNSYVIPIILLVALAGCKSSGVMHCPDISSGTHHQINWAIKSSKSVDLKQHSTTHEAHAPEAKEEITASTDNNIHIKIRMPAFITRQVEPEGELEGMNKLLGDYSNNKVSLQRNKKGKVFFTASSVKDVLKLSQNLAAHKAAAPGDTGGRIALASGILGIIGFVFALGPWIGFGSFLISVVAVILGIIGLGSSRRGWAITGIVLGVLAIAIAAALSGVFFVVLHF